MRRVACLVGHDVPQQHNVPRVDVHVVGFHSVLNFVDDGLAGCLDTEDLGDFDDMVGGREFANDTCIQQRSK